MNKRIIFIILLIINWSAAFGLDPDGVVIQNFEGDNSDKSALLAKAELKLYRELRYCRGMYLASITKKWSCTKSDTDFISCKREYKCIRMKHSRERSRKLRKAKKAFRKSKILNYFRFWNESDIEINFYDNYKTAKELNKFYKQDIIKPSQIIIVDDLGDLGQLVGKDSAINDKNGDSFFVFEDLEENENTEEKK